MARRMRFSNTVGEEFSIYLILIEIGLRIQVLMFGRNEALEEQVNLTYCP